MYWKKDDVYRMSDYKETCYFYICLVKADNDHSHAVWKGRQALELLIVMNEHVHLDVNIVHLHFISVEIAVFCCTEIDFSSGSWGGTFELLFQYWLDSLLGHHIFTFSDEIAGGADSREAKDWGEFHLSLSF